jgi:shikimate dehydrogenase
MPRNVRNRSGFIHETMAIPCSIRDSLLSQAHPTLPSVPRQRVINAINPPFSMGENLASCQRVSMTRRRLFALEAPSSLPYNQPVPEIFDTPIDATTRYCAVYGHPINHSASPAMQNAGIAALGLNWRYLAFEVHLSELAEAIRGAQVMKFVGLNLTVPHKLLALQMVDALDETAKSWGAVNTIRFEAKDAQGEWTPLARIASSEIRQVRSHGFNTDADAIARALREDLGVSLEGASVLLLGAGGAGRVAAFKLASEGVASLFLVNRTVEKAAEVAAEIRQRYPGVAINVGYPKAGVDLLLNATSLGLKPSDPCPLDENVFPIAEARAVYDMIYRPAETLLLARARSAGVPVANGLGMLLYQGTKALELWTDQPAPVNAMREALESNIYGPDHRSHEPIQRHV